MEHHHYERNPFHHHTIPVVRVVEDAVVGVRAERKFVAPQGGYLRVHRGRSCGRTDDTIGRNQDQNHAQQGTGWGGADCSVACTRRGLRDVSQRNWAQNVLDQCWRGDILGVLRARPLDVGPGVSI